MIYAILGCLIIIGFLGVKLYQKKTIDTQLINEYQAQIQKVKEQLDSDQEALNQYNSKLVDVRIKVNTEQQKLTDLYNQLDSAQINLSDAREEYYHLVNDKMKEINSVMEKQRQQRQEELDKSFTAEEENYKLQLNNIMADCKMREELALEQTAQSIQASEEQRLEYLRLCGIEQARYESLLAPIKQYEKEKQEKLFYTIQLPEEYYDDIEFLLTTVSTKVQHPDIISKLVWSEYIKPNLDDTFKRIEIKAEPGIYKITNINNGKAYIGKSTDVKKRIADHLKSAVGMRSIADQVVHHEILKTGFWNWTIEVITYCDKDKLSELEKYYIDFFQTNSYGYNRTGGGEG